MEFWTSGDMLPLKYLGKSWVLCDVMWREQIFLFHNLPFLQVISGPAPPPKKIPWIQATKEDHKLFLAGLCQLCKLSQNWKNWGFASCQYYPYWVFLPKIVSRLCLNQSKRREGGPLKAQTIHGFLQAWERERRNICLPLLHWGD